MKLSDNEKLSLAAAKANLEYYRNLASKALKEAKIAMEKQTKIMQEYNCNLWSNEHEKL